MMGASTTQPHALGMYGQTISPPRARSSPLPWIIGIAGLVVTSPYWLYQIWAVILPGLHPNERGVAIIVEHIAPYVARLIGGS